MRIFRITLLVALCVLTGFVAQSANAQITVRVKKAASLTWNNIYIYNYINDQAAECGGWPGKQLTPNAEGWYSYTFTGEPGGVIFHNNAGSQFDAPSITTSVCFEIAAAGISTTDCPANTPDPESVVIRWKQISGGWTTMAMYAWGASPVGETFGEWPGTVVTPNAEGWYSVTVPVGQTVGNVIFNNGISGNEPGGAQFNADVVSNTTACYEITATSATRVTCPDDSGDHPIMRWKQAAGLNWTDMYLYNYVNDAPAEMGGWPGKKFTADANGWYSYTFVGDPGNVIFNNGEGSQVFGPFGSEVDGCFEIALTGYTTIECTGTGITQPEQKGIAVYPNPATSTLTISASNIQSLSILNVNGQKVLKPVLKNNSVNIQSLATGAYVVEVQLEDGTIQHLKFIKN
jgi:hypothetical protein